MSVNFIMDNPGFIIIKKDIPVKNNTLEKPKPKIKKEKADIKFI
jgi:hypothetical protein